MNVPGYKVFTQDFVVHCGGIGDLGATMQNAWFDDAGVPDLGCRNW